MIRKLGLFIAILTGTLLVSACKNDAQPKESPSSIESSSAVQIRPAFEPNYGDTETIGDLQYTFIGLFAEGSVGSGEQAITGEKGLYSVMMTVKNIGNQAVTVDPSYFTLISGAKTFFVAETATLYKNEYEEEDENSLDYQISEQYASGVPKGTILTTLESGEERNGFLIFGVDSDTFVKEEGEAPVVEKLEIKSNQSSGETIVFYFY